MDTAGLSSYLDGPGLEASVLVPREGSLSGLMDRLGTRRFCGKECINLCTGSLKLEVQIKFSGFHRLEC